MTSSLSRARVRTALGAAALLALPLVAGCSAVRAAGSTRPGDTWVQGSPAATGSAAPGREESADTATAAHLLPGMPPPLVADDLYAADRPNALSPVVRNDKSLVYVPNLDSNTVSVLDPRTYKVLRTVPVGKGPQHVVPAWDLKTLWVNDDTGNALTPINPVTGTVGKSVPVEDPYNLYFTPDGKYAVVMEEQRKEIVFRDPHTMAVKDVLPVKCSGVNHADFSPDGRYFIVTCEFSGDLIKVDTVAHKVIAQLRLPGEMPMPQDIKISPDGKTWYVADMQTSGVWILDGDKFTTPTFLPTGDGAHGLYPSRDSKYLYVANRGEGSISLISFATRTVVKKWKLPGRTSPDMGGVSADGKVLWLSGRYNAEVYAIDTTTGKLLARIKVGKQPHGLCVWPQPGRYSLGHTGILR
ncbi:beta-propeller fold lactonase family protein [Actinoplanes subtropicus]|uniref:YVTN family beta-propeller repeat protein n=1 Tax=Actinoplanes subtropicus TaxID=543632 RepID=UPI0004C446B5|nr:beta-propeller fold lactonase family protein [Actinoplanes subtropicus]